MCRCPTPAGQVPREQTNNETTQHHQTLCTGIIYMYIHIHVCIHVILLRVHTVYSMHVHVKYTRPWLPLLSNQSG